MKYVLRVALTLMAGVLIGVLSQRGEIHDAQLRIEELEGRDCSSRGIGRGLAVAGPPNDDLDATSVVVARHLSSAGIAIREMRRGLSLERSYLDRVGEVSSEGGNHG